jgi:hypothetical protein
MAQNYGLDTRCETFVCVVVSLSTAAFCKYSMRSTCVYMRPACSYNYRYVHVIRSLNSKNTSKYYFYIFERLETFAVVRCLDGMLFVTVPRRALLTVRKKGCGYENVLVS